MPLRASELASIRAVNAEWLNQTASSITRPDGGQTDDGWPDASPTTVASNVACRCEPDGKTGTERTAGAGVAAGDRWLVIFGHDVATLKPMDTITVTSVGVFEVQNVTSGRGVNTDVVARCVRLEAA
jgi:hypothetical protein